MKHAQILNSRQHWTVKTEKTGNVRSESYDNHPSFLPGGCFQITVLERWKEGEDK